MIETCDGPIEICFSCGDEAGLRIGIDAPSSMRILRREGQRKWCLPPYQAPGGGEPATQEPAAQVAASVAPQPDPLPVFAEPDDDDWWRHPDDARIGVSGAAAPMDPAPDDDEPLWI